MKKTRFTETQIVKAIHEEQAGRKAEDICRELGIAPSQSLRLRDSAHIKT
jgi:putative transposase